MTAIETLADIISNGILDQINRDELGRKWQETLESIFGERYQARSGRAERVVLMPKNENISFAGFVHPDSPNSGAYGGMSLIWFPLPADDGQSACSLLTFVCGTRGISPDETILGRPGHSRHLGALRRYLVRKTKCLVWTKQDPTNLNQQIPEIIKLRHQRFSSIFERYGNFIYAMVEVPTIPADALEVVKAFIDFYAWERNWSPLKGSKLEIDSFKNALRANLFPLIDQEQIVKLLLERRFVILEGPPGTGKTRLALKILNEEFEGAGFPVQFHPAVTYETFIAGISPMVSGENLNFSISPGWLVQAIRQSKQHKKFLLLIDEINRADLGRVLGEAIYLFEPREISDTDGRKIKLPQALEDGTEEIQIPENLYILGTMNSADRSIAILDLAVRRRFAFVSVWPDISILETQQDELALEAFALLQDIFAQYVPEESIVLLPGHSYFFAENKNELINRFRYELIPILKEYLYEGRLGSCESEILAYIDWLEGKIVEYEAKPV
jgi:5-methylcytosine-specific restriction protein B